MTIYLFSAVYLFYSRIIFKKLDDSARILFRKVEKTFKNAAKLRADINFLKYIIVKKHIAAGDWYIRFHHKG